jgi:hypothetical protein
MLIPSLQDEGGVLFNDRNQFIQFRGRKSISFSQFDCGMYPEFGELSGTANMNVHRLSRFALIAEEEETTTAMAEDDGHSGQLP